MKYGVEKRKFTVQELQSNCQSKYIRSETQPSADLKHLSITPPSMNSLPTEKPTVLQFKQGKLGNLGYN